MLKSRIRFGHPSERFAYISRCFEYSPDEDPFGWNHIPRMLLGTLNIWKWCISGGPEQQVFFGLRGLISNKRPSRVLHQRARFRIEWVSARRNRSPLPNLVPKMDFGEAVQRCWEQRLKRTSHLHQGNT